MLLELLGGHAAGFNDWQFSLLTPFTALSKAMIVLAGAAAVFMSWRALGVGLPRRRFGVLMALRTAGVMAVVWAALEPAFTLQNVNRIKNRLAMVIDTSGSMDLAVSRGALRRHLVRDFAQAIRGELPDLGKRFEIETLRFDSDARAAPLESIVELLGDAPPVAPGAAGPRLPKLGPATDIAGALERAARDPAGRRLAGIVLVSDGVDTETLESGNPSGKLIAALRQLEAPVHVFGVGTGVSFRDVAVDQVIADDFAFIRNTIEIEAVITVSGFSSGMLPVTLAREGAPLQTQEVPLNEARSPYTVKFKLAPDQVGKFIYTVQVPVLGEEAVTVNNQKSFILKVIRDKLRVLHVTGTPSWDVRFLRELLKRNTGIDLISFFILRTPEDIPAVRDNELSLIPFPTRELFTEQLRTFDIVVFQNFNYGPYEMRGYLAHIRDYVRDHGGGFVMIGGDRSFGSGEYWGTEIEDILPFTLPFGRAAADDSFVARTTPDGARHPILALTRGAEARDDVVPGLPELTGINRVGPLRAGATALLVHPFHTTGQQPAPVVAVTEFGSGRCLAITTDSLWHWAFAPALAAGDNRYYVRFWQNAMRWLTRDPELRTLEAVSRKPEYGPGEDAVVDILALDSKYAPAAGAEIDIEVRAGAKPEAVLRTKTVADARGRARLDMPEPVPAAYRVRVSARHQGVSLGSEQEVFIVRAGTKETRRVHPNGRLLRDLANLTGGEFKDLPQKSLRGLSFRDPEVIRVDKKRHFPLWDGWPALALVCLVFGAEWFLRRRWGYL